MEGDVAPELTTAPRRAEAKPRRRRRWWIWVVVAVLVLAVLGVGAWLGMKVLTVRDALAASQAEVGRIQSNQADIGDSIHAIAGHARVADAAAHDPVWLLAEHVPMAGDNLRAVRLASEALRLLTADVGEPALAALKDPGDTPVLARVLPVLKDAAPKVSQLSSEVDQASQSTALIEQVRDGVASVDQVLKATAPIFETVPVVLGADGPRSYLLVAQNNAEAIGLGGAASSVSLLQIENGHLKLGNQQASGDFENGKPTKVKVDQSALDLFGKYLVSQPSTSSSRPDFPTMARLLESFWKRDISSDKVDGVISLDPLALSRILKATGPIKVSGGQEITAENAVQVLLRDVYSWSDDPHASDDFFKVVAVAVFDHIARGDFDPAQMLSAVRTSIDQGSIMAWFADETEQARIAPMRLSGILPTTNSPETTFGVYYRDASGGTKMSYYLASSVKASLRCDAGVTYLDTSVTLKFDISQKAADALPPYVKSQIWGSKQLKTQVFVYGPPGGSVSATTMGHDDVPWRDPTTDLGRPVASFTTTLRPQGKTTVHASFALSDGERGPLAFRGTPMVKPTAVELKAGGC